MDFFLASVSFQVLSCIIIIILICYQYSSKYRYLKTSRCFLLVLYSFFFAEFFDFFTWIFDGHSNPLVINLIWLSSLFTYFFSFLTEISLFYYIILNLNFDVKTENKLKKICFAVLISLFAFTIIMQTNGLIYFYNEGGSFEFGKFYWLIGLIQEIIFFALTVMIIFYRKRFGFFKTLIFLSHPLLPLITMIISNYFNPYITIFSYTSMLVSTLLIFLNIQIELERKLKERELELSENRIAIMNSQIQPHFLYNSLSAISDLCDDNADAQTALLMFSKYLRTNMDSLSEKTLISFEKEMEHVREYLWLEKLRFRERLEIEYEIVETGFMLPMLTLQPIVENAVRYGINQRPAGGKLTIRTEKKADGFYVNIIDDGVGFNPFSTEEKTIDSRSHIGIKNVRERLSAMCGGELIIESAIGIGTTAIIKIPIK